MLPYKLPPEVILSNVLLTLTFITVVSGATEAKNKPDNMDTSNSSKHLIFLVHIQVKHVNHQLVHRKISLV